jgi:hypothetical protein
MKNSPKQQMGKYHAIRCQNTKVKTSHITGGTSQMIHLIEFGKSKQQVQTKECQIPHGGLVIRREKAFI